MHFYPARAMPFTPNLLSVGSIGGLGPDLQGIHSMSLAAQQKNCRQIEHAQQGP